MDAWHRYGQQGVLTTVLYFSVITLVITVGDNILHCVLAAVTVVITVLQKYSEHNLLLFADQARNQLWTKWTLGIVMDNKVCSLPYCISVSSRS